MNRTQTTFRIREQMDGFMGIVSPHFFRPMGKFLRQMVFRMQSAKDIKLSCIGRSLDEPIPLRKTETRLARNLAAEGMDGRLNAIVAQATTGQHLVELSPPESTTVKPRSDGEDPCPRLYLAGLGGGSVFCIVVISSP